MIHFRQEYQSFSVENDRFRIILISNFNKGKSVGTPAGNRALVNCWQKIEVILGHSRSKIGLFHPI